MITHLTSCSFYVHSYIFTAQRLDTPIWETTKIWVLGYGAVFTKISKDQTYDKAWIPGLRPIWWTFLSELKSVEQLKQRNRKHSECILPTVIASCIQWEYWCQSYKLPCDGEGPWPSPTMIWLFSQEPSIGLRLFSKPILPSRRPCSLPNCFQ